jgi:hypothetical protein
MMAIILGVWGDNYLMTMHSINESMCLLLLTERCIYCRVCEIVKFEFLTKMDDIKVLEPLTHLHLSGCKGL